MPAAPRRRAIPFPYQDTVAMESLYLLIPLSILLVFIFKQPFKRINEETMQQSAILNSQMI